jgi:tripartite ATP-independent transporter DctM subunit
MEWWVTLIIAFVLLIFFFSLGLPVAFAFFALNIIGLSLLFGERGMTLLTNSFFDSVASFSLTPIPMFIFLGEIFYQSEAVNIAFDAIDTWVGGVRARLHIVTLLFSTIWGAISGAAMGVVAMLGTTVLPEMNKRGYDRRLSIGVILGGACLDPLIPPSVVAVLVASLANISIAKLLFAGFGPGFMYSAMFVIYVIIAVKLNPKLAPVYLVSSSLREKALSLVKLLPFGLIIFLILGLLMMGIASPTESAATGVAGALILAACLGKLTLKRLKDALLGTVRVSAMTLLIIAGSKAFSQILAMTGATHGLTDIVTKNDLSPLALLILMQLIPLFLGCFIDTISIMLITIPVFVPVVTVAGFDPIWFWCLFLINMVVGGITPPFGLYLFVMKATTKETPLEEVYRAAIPFVLIVLLGMIFVIIFPEIAVWIPNKFID